MSQTRKVSQNVWGSIRPAFKPDCHIHTNSYALYINTEEIAGEIATTNLIVACGPRIRFRLREQPVPSTKKSETFSNNQYTTAYAQERGTRMSQYIAGRVKDPEMYF